MGLSVSIGGIMVPLIGKFADSYGLVATMQLLTSIAVVAALASFFLPNPDDK